MLLLLALACAPAPDPDSFLLETETASAFGHHTVDVRVPAGTAVSSAVVGGLPAYDLHQSGDLVTFTIQGSPNAGPASVVLQTGGGAVELATPLQIRGPADPLFDRLVGVGASLTMGVQDGVPTTHAQLMSPGAQIARQAGAFYGIPLLVDGLFPEIGLADIGPPPSCETPAVVRHVASAAVDVLGKLNTEDDQLSYALGRYDPDLAVQNLAVGGYSVGDLTRPVTSFELGFLGHLVMEPYGEVNGPIDDNQVQRAAALDPTLVWSFDTFGNDLIGAVVLQPRIDLGKITDEETFREGIVRLMDGLADTDAEVFLANSPRPGLLPAAGQLVAAAEDLDAAQALIDEADAICIRYNEILAEEAALRPRVHVVDAWQMAEDFTDGGVVADGQSLDVHRFGGLLSLDGVHFTDTGYAAMANAFLDAMDAELGVDIDRLDLDAVAAEDAHTPEAYLAGGFDRSTCDR
jgi:lysophospholipase L1-like esterase